MKFVFANILYRQKKWELSIPLFKSCIKSNFKLDKSSQKLMFAYKQIGKVKEGYNFLTKTICNETASSYYTMGMVFRYIKDWNKARMYLRKAYEKSPHNKLIFDRYIRTLYDERNTNELIRVLKTSDHNKFDSLDEDSFLFLYKYCLNNGSKTEANQILRLGYKLTKEGGSGKLAFLLGRKLFTEENWDEARIVFDKAKALGNSRAEHYIELIKHYKVWKQFNGYYEQGDDSSLNQLFMNIELNNVKILKKLLKKWCEDHEGKVIIANKDKICYEFAKRHIANEPEFFALQITLYAALNDEEGIRKWVNNKTAESSEEKKEIYHTVAKILRGHERYRLALEYALKAHSLDKKNATIVRLVSELYHKLGNTSKSIHYLDREFKLRKSEAIKKQIMRKRRFLEGEYKFYQKRLRPFENVCSDDSYKGIEKRVLHLHHNSVPYAGGGYAIRGKYIIKNLRELGVDAIVATRPGYPFDLGKSEKLESDNSILVKDTSVDFPIYRLGQNLRWKGTPVDEYIDQYVDVLDKAVLELKPSILHPASNFFNGIAAAYVAKKYNIPLVYEVRGLWELTRASLTEGYEGSERYEYMKFLETTAMELADHVVTISYGLKEEILHRGIPESKITVIPNAVDCSVFNPVPCNEVLKDELGLSGKTVIGFIGTLTAYEGLELLIEAFKQISRSRDDIRVLIVGDGAISDQLKAMVENENLQGKVIFTGRVPHEKVKDYYSIIDIFPFPRRDWPVCNIVTPLKPYEVMAMQKALLVSDVGALKEMVIDQKTGLYFKADSVADLMDKLLILIDQPDLREQLARNARRWVLENRDWRNQTRHYLKIYDQIVNS